MLNLQTPLFISQVIDTTFGSVVLLLLGLSLFMQVNPIIGVLGLAVIFKIIRRANVNTGSYAMNNYLPSEDLKLKHMKAYNVENGPGKFERTLEEELVQKHDQSSNKMSKVYTLHL